MRFLKGLFAFFLVIIIIGGIGFIGYNIYMGNLFGGNMNMSMGSTQNTTQNTNQSTQQNTSQASSDTGSMNMSGMNGSANTANQTTAIPNPYDAQNRAKLQEATDLINAALEQITIDPYSNATVPDSSTQMNGMQGQTSQGTGTINIYPSDSSTVSILPDNDTTGTSQSTMGSMNMGATDSTGTINHVYDQAKLQQLHSGIYTIAQGVMAIEELNDKLLTQSMTLEQQPYTYQTYVNRYNTALQNQTDLEKTMAQLNNASVLINVNPYASDSGYDYDGNSMKQLHDGIYKFAQGMATLESLYTDFENQMTTASMSAQKLTYSMGSMSMQGSSSSLLGNLSLSSIFNLILVVLVIGLIIGILGAIVSLFRRKPQPNG